MTPKIKLAPVHPGEILLEEFIQPLGGWGKSYLLFY